MLELLDPLFTRRREVHVGVHDRRHDGFATEIDAGGAPRDFHICPPPRLGEAAARDHEHRILDRSASVPHDEASTFIHGRTRLAACLRTTAGGHQDDH